MTLDEIRAAFRSSAGPTPAAALRAAVPHADVLAPEIAGLSAKLCRGVYLLPDENAVLFYGLHVLAAARHRALPALIQDLLRQPQADLDQLFPDYTSISLGRLLLTMWDGDTDNLLRMLELEDLAPDVVAALLDVATQLSRDGRMERGRLVDVLEKIELNSVFDDLDEAWWSWEDSVAKLRATRLEPALHRVWSKPVNGFRREQDWAETLELLNSEPSTAGATQSLDEAALLPVHDPAEAVYWVDRRAEFQAELRSERAGVADVASGPLLPGLDEDDIVWLAGFLNSRQVPAATIPLEMLDGLLTALAIGPGNVAQADWLAEVWGTEDGRGPSWDGTGQEQHFMQLLQKHRDGIAARRDHDLPIRPMILQGLETGVDWSIGFGIGVDLAGDEWGLIFNDRRSAALVEPIYALSDVPHSAAERLGRKARDEIVGALPELLRAIARFWRDPFAGLLTAQPARSSKVGRNDPCPCGSSRKYKKCCGTASTGP